MEQLILHLFGDYVTQTDWMAKNKRQRWIAAWVHAVVYGLPFLLIAPSAGAIVTIIVTHFLIDWLGLARYVVYAKNKANDWSLKWNDCRVTGYPATSPIWLTTWLLIIADNTLHLSINYAALRWL